MANPFLHWHSTFSGPLNQHDAITRRSILLFKQGHVLNWASTRMLELLWINVISVVFLILCGSYKHNPHSAKSSCCHMVISESSLHHSSHSHAIQSSPPSRALPISLFAGRKPSRRTTLYWTAKDFQLVDGW